MSTVTQGMYITVVGMGLVFLALGLILLVMVLLQKAFSAKATEAESRSASVAAPAAESSPATTIEKEKIAAISVALSWAMADDKRRTLPAGAESRGGSPSHWVVAGRSRQLHHPRSREKTR